jgi:hypothetical protein
VPPLGAGTAQLSTSGVVSKAPLTQFTELPLPLQTYILALGGAPLTTCKAAVAVLQQPDLTATWLVAATSYPFETAAQAQKWDVCLHLLSNSNSIRVPYWNSSLPAMLGLAARHGRVDVAQRLIAEGAWAQVCESKHSRDFLLPYRTAKPGHPGSQCTADIYIPHPLICAADGGRADVVALLLNQPGVPVPASVGRQALCIAAAAGNIPTMQLLLAFLPGITAPGGADGELSDALGHAAAAGNMQVVQLLLDTAPWLTHGFDGQALLLAAKNQHTAVMRVLLEAGTGVPRNSISAAFMASAQVGSVEGLALLKQHGADVNRREGCCWSSKTPMQHALHHNHAAAVQWLLENGVTAQPSHLLEAIQYGATDAARQLIQHGVWDRHDNRLFMAARRGYTGPVHMLLDAHLPERPQEAAAVRAARLELTSSCRQAGLVKSLLECQAAAFPPGAPQGVCGTGATTAAAVAAATGTSAEGDCSTDDQSSTFPNAGKAGGRCKE